MLAEQPETGAQVKIYGPLNRHYDSFLKFQGFRRFILLPCGKCLSCRMAHAREWVSRVHHELQINHGLACFVTLTYNDEHLPKVDGSPSLFKPHYQNFFKRLRKITRVRYLGCGEYGSIGHRPHYHFLIFGWQPDDLVFWKFNEHGQPLYLSATLEKLWSDKNGLLGWVTVGNVETRSIEYVCRYNLKKLDDDYSNYPVKPFIVSSSKPGIGLGWFEKFYTDCIKKDLNGEVVLANCRSGDKLSIIPRYYRKRLALSHPDLADQLNLFLRDLAAAKVPTLEDISRAIRYNSVRHSHNTNYGKIVNPNNPKELLT